MPPDGDVVIVFGTLFACFLLSLLYAGFHQVIRYKTARRKSEADPSQSVGLSDLEALMRETVAEATRPLADRVAALEASIKSLHATLSNDADLKRVLPHGEYGEDALFEVSDDEAQEEFAPRRSTRRIR